jgi:dTDP-glucose 4,6-dehydratase
VGSHPEIIDGSFKHINMDVSKREVIGAIIAEEPDYVIHAAAYSDVDGSIKMPEVIFFNNAVSTLWLFEACRLMPNLKRFIYVSTDEVYGECEHRKREDEIIFPRNPYSMTKAVGSLMRLAYDNTYVQLLDKTSETRFCNVYGPRQDARKIIPAIKRAYDEGTPVPVHNGGKGYREFIYVKEIPPVIELLLLSEEEGRTYNVTANVGYTVEGLLALAEKVTGKPVPTVPSNRAGMDERYQMSNERLTNEFGWAPRFNFQEAFAAYLQGQPL